jgi:hypothetical protein
MHYLMKKEEMEKDKKEKKGENALMRNEFI